jgi:hypothetical protein
MYSLPQSGAVRLEVFDVLGRTAGIVELGIQPAGEHRIVLDVRRMAVSSGVYYYRVRCGGAYTKSMKAVILQ